ncbi:MAG: hypothetical protein RR306_00500 [Clostridia bacterium]
MKNLKTKISNLQLISILICTRLVFLLSSFSFLNLDFNLSIFIYLLVSNTITIFLFFVFSKITLPKALCVFITIISIAIILFVSLISFSSASYKLNLFFLIFLFLVAAIYGAFRGIESISRVSFLIVIAFIILFSLSLLGFLKNNIYYNLSSFSLNISPYFLVLNVGFIEAFIYSMLRKNMVGGNLLFIYFIITIITSLFIIAIIYGVLGNVATSYPFPFFSACSVSKSGFIRRLDVFFNCFYILISLITASSLFYILASLFKKGDKNEEH